MHILITGGAGFIGSHSVHAALAAGHQVRVLDNLTTGVAANVPAGAELVEGDIRDPAAVAAAMAGCDAVLHLAALVSVPQSLREPAETFQINTAGTALLLEAARQAEVRRFVLVSTCAVYGDLPGRKDESSPTQPLAPYAASKLMAEQWAQVYAHAYAMQTVILRYFNVYGPRQRADSPYSGVLARWCAASVAGQPCVVFGDGSQTRDFVSVHDVAAANLLALTAGASASPAAPDTLQAGSVYHVATGRSASLNQVLDALAAVSPRGVQVRHDAPRQATFCIRRAAASVCRPSAGGRG